MKLALLLSSFGLDPVVVKLILQDSTLLACKPVYMLPMYSSSAAASTVIVRLVEWNASPQAWLPHFAGCRMQHGGDEFGGGEASELPSHRAARFQAEVHAVDELDPEVLQNAVLAPPPDRKLMVYNDI